LVFVTKYRHPVFTDAHLSRLEDIFQAVCANFGCDLVECNGEAEHVHLLITYPRRCNCPGW
jgi:putative transposase